jgi:hypothetical protein
VAKYTTALNRLLSNTPKGVRFVGDLATEETNSRRLPCASHRVLSAPTTYLALLRRPCEAFALR